jgi:hypothetical protein
MTRSIFVSLILACFVITSQAQKSEGGKPFSGFLMLKSTSSLPQVTLKSLDIEKLLSEEAQDPVKIRYGIFSDTVLNLKTIGRSDVIESLGTIWRLRISNSNAKSIQLIFSKFLIPEGAKLFLYNDKQDFQAGAFTKDNIRSDSAFTIADFKGNHVIVEYFEPFNAEFDGRIIIGAIGQAYKDPLNSEAAIDFININCPIGKDAQLIKHAVCKMSFRSGIYQATCSGALINNAKQDGKPYFLTANHCISKSEEATSLVTYFNYEIAGCSGDTLVPLTLSGSSLLSTGQPSDYTLLLLNDTLSPEYQGYFAGWDMNDVATNMVTGVHVPFSETKKISIDKDSIFENPVMVTWDDNSKSPIGSHWIVGYDEGKTSGGSSGSPLFNSNNQIIGQLHGGDDEMEFYGKLAYSYSNKPALYHSLRHFLDPDSTGITVLDGYTPLGNLPDAFFTTPFENICNNTPISFTDYSVFHPFERSWTVSPSTFAFVDGTSDTSSTPKIVFNEVQAYTVRLDLLVGGEVKSSESLVVNSGNELAIKVSSIVTNELCACDFSSIKLNASGAENYSWSIVQTDSSKAFLTRNTGDTTTIVHNPDFYAGSGYTISLKVSGSQGTCIGTTNHTYNLLKPSNDDITGAILLSMGKSDFYTNICASVEEGEPVPPVTSCTAQGSWCDEYGTGENIVENSVWFKFFATETGRISITSNGFDNQLALYKANTYSDILNGNFVMLGASDDRSETDSRPYIISANVIKDDPYWIQVDGSGGGLEDDFYVTLTKLAATATDNPISENMEVYPQPAMDWVYIRNASWIGADAQIKVYNASGAAILNKEVAVTGNEIQVNLSSWEPGIYVAVISLNAEVYVVKIVKGQ